jgi:hypothetical protein
MADGRGHRGSDLAQAMAEEHDIKPETALNLLRQAHLADLLERRYAVEDGHRRVWYRRPGVEVGNDQPITQIVYT